MKLLFVRTMLTATAALCLFGCDKVASIVSPKPSAKEACEKLVAAGLGSGCKEVKPEGVNVRCASKYDFDLKAPAGKGAGVMSFANAEDYKFTVDLYTSTAMIAGPHRYGNEKALVFVQMNRDASLEDGKKAKAVIDAL